MSDFFKCVAVYLVVSFLLGVINTSFGDSQLGYYERSWDFEELGRVEKSRDWFSSIEYDHKGKTIYINREQRLTPSNQKEGVYQKYTAIFDDGILYMGKGGGITYRWGFERDSEMTYAYSERFVAYDWMTAPLLPIWLFFAYK